MRAAAAALLVVLGAGRSAAADVRCAPSADLAGDGDLAAAVAEELARTGVVAAEAEDACPAVHVAVHRDGARVAVTVRAGGRIEGRVVSDAATAAAWIASWAAGDDDALAVSLLPAPRPLTPAMIAPAPVPAAGAVIAARAAPVSPARWGTLSAGLDGAAGDDGSRWSGWRVDACARVGAVCVGGRARRLGDDGWTNNGGLTLADRRSTDLVATLAVPLALAGARVSPTVGAGVGWVHTGRHEGEECGGSNPGGPGSNGALPPPPSPPSIAPDGTVDIPVGCGGPLYIGDGFATTTVAPRLEAGVSVAIPLASAVYLDVQLAAQLAPGAHTAPHRPGQTSGQDDPSGAPPPPPLPMLDLPGEPSRWWTAAIGLRFGELR